MKACKKCKYITNEKICPKCGSKEFSTKFKGRILIFDKDSIVSKYLNLEEGEWAAIVED